LEGELGVFGEVFAEGIERDVEVGGVVAEAVLEEGEGVHFGKYKRGEDRASLFKN
jgi:hypothetical protein